MMERGSWKSSAEICPACPRCGSANTKFCYYNNYSLTQPRYFCKGCRRYWTKGGSLRNVPVGGGCRKSRRGKSATIRVSTFHNPTTNSSSSISTAPDKYASSSSTSSTGTIDIAAVYANFLTQPPNQITHETTLPNDQLPDGVLNIPPPVEFPSFQGLHMNDYHGFFECGPFGGTRLIMSEQPLLGAGSSIFYGGGVEGLNIHQKPGINNGSFSINNGMENGGILSSLPPLPGEDVAAADSSEGMLWPDSDVMLPAMDERPRAVVGPPGGEMMNSELLSGNVSPFSALNLEAIFRS